MIVQCAFLGNSDIYGLGVRMGIYLQWFTSILAETLSDPAVESTREANTTYQIAMLAGLILITNNTGFGTRGIEGFITLLFCFASAWISSLQIYSTAKFTHSSENLGRNARSIADLLLNTAICSYGVWFLFIRLDTLPRTACPETVFFFAPVKLFGWFRVFLQVVFSLSLAGSAILIPLRIYCIAHNLSESMKRWGQPGLPTARHIELVRTVDVSAKRLFGSIAAMAVFVVAVELTLIWNHIQGIYTCDNFSQLFPLVVGATNLARVVTKTIKSVTLGDIVIRMNI